jgi:hypothetical protein
MTNKLFGIILFALGSCATCFGQSSFQGITPGTSTRSDVAGVLGQPVRTISANRFEHKRPAGIAKVEVAYISGPSVEHIEVYFLRPISSPALMQKLELKSSFINLHRADARGKTSQGKLVEYFLTPMLVFTYQADDTSSGVSQIGYYSEALFNKVFAEKTEKGEAHVIDITEEEKSQAPGLTGLYGEITGIVKLRTSDGSLKPVAGATVDFYRTDMKGHHQTKTNEYGIFIYQGLSQTGNWIVAASAPGLKWGGVKGVRTPVAGIEIIAEPGDGMRPTFEEVMAAIR